MSRAVLVGGAALVIVAAVVLARHLDRDPPSATPGAAGRMKIAVAPEPSGATTAGPKLETLPPESIPSPAAGAASSPFADPPLGPPRTALPPTATYRRAPPRWVEGDAPSDVGEDEAAEDRDDAYPRPDRYRQYAEPGPYDRGEEPFRRFGRPYGRPPAEEDEMDEPPPPWSFLPAWRRGE